MKEIKVSIRCFGMFRQFGNEMDVSILANSSVDDIKGAIVRRLGEKYKEIVRSSVLASDLGILPGEYIVYAPVELSILPPVCGG